MHNLLAILQKMRPLCSSVLEEYPPNKNRRWQSKEGAKQPQVPSERVRLRHPCWSECDFHCEFSRSLDLVIWLSMNRGNNELDYQKTPYVV